MTMNKKILLLAVASVMMVLGQPAWAKPRPSSPHPNPGPARPSPWGGDIQRFHDRDFDYWKQGRWFHGPHEGRDGWWWIVGGLWYFYSTPVYPYPDPFTPSTVIIETAPAVPVPAGPQYWYCSDPIGYYPYVPRCYAEWQRIGGPSAIVVAPAPTQAPTSPSGPAVAYPTNDFNKALRDETQINEDYKTLNGFSSEFSQIDLNAKTAKSELRKLSRKLEKFRKLLIKRDYNSMDVLNDAEDLTDRIEEQKEALRR